MTEEVGQGGRDGFSRGCTVPAFTSWGRSHSKASLQKHCLTALFQGTFSFLAFRHIARWETYILWSPTCNVVLNNTPWSMDSSANLQRNNSVTSITGELHNSNLILKGSPLLSTEGVQHWQPLSLGCQRASAYANCGSVFLTWTFFWQSQKRSIGWVILNQGPGSWSLWILSN